MLLRVYRLSSRKFFSGPERASMYASKTKALHDEGFAWKGSGAFIVTLYGNTFTPSMTSHSTLAQEPHIVA